MKPHTFAICAYKDSPYLESCIRSIKTQSVESDVILCTSTPSTYISGLADQYGIPLFIRHEKSSIRDDWNFAYNMADATFVTIAHQDDLYQKDYVKNLLNCYGRYPDMTLFTGGYVVVLHVHIIRNNWGNHSLPPPIILPWTGIRFMSCLSCQDVLSVWRNPFFIIGSMKEQPQRQPLRITAV